MVCASLNNSEAWPNRVLSPRLPAFFFLMVAGQRTDAHKPVTSQYDYNKDIFPLLRDHCGACHVPGGPAPMPLMTYRDAVPWAESIRDELTAGRMPPWPVDPMSPQVQGAHPISASDVDKIVVWATGGTPQGDPAATLPAVTFNAQWKLGPPDLEMEMDAGHTVRPGAIEDTVELSLPVALGDTKWVKAADLMPGTASIVRDAVISIENGPVLSLWEPGADPIAAPAGTAFRLAPGAKIHLEIHYKKHFDQEQRAVSDKSTIGLYFTDPPASGRELQSLVSRKQPTKPPPSRATQAHRPSWQARSPAPRASLHFAPCSIAPTARSKSTPSHRPARASRSCACVGRPQWFQRYWLRQPAELPSGSKIELRTTPLPDDSEEPATPKRFQLQVALDFIQR